MNVRNWVLFCLMVFLWSLNWSAMKIGLRYVPPYTFLMQRSALSIAFLLPLFLIRRTKLPKDKNTLFRLTVLSIVFTGFMSFQFYGLVQESSGLSAVLVYTQPLFVFCLAVPFLKEHVTKVRLLGVLTGFLGILVLFVSRIGSFTLFPSLALLTCAAMWAIEPIYYKLTLSHVDSLVTHFFQLSVGSIPFVFMSLTENSSANPVDWLYVGVVFFCAAGPLAIGRLIWLMLLKKEEAVIVSGSGLIVPVVSVFFGWLLLGEIFTVEFLVGSTLSLVGVYLLNIRRGKNGAMRNNMLSQSYGEQD